MDEKIKVTDKRMFTADGELREGYQDKVEGDKTSTAEVAEATAASADTPTPSKPVEPGKPEVQKQPEPRVTAAREVEPAPTPGEPKDEHARRPARRDDDLPAPTFMDLVGLLAQPIAMFLGDAAMPGSEPEENLPLARFHIDLLELVQAKTQGNISAEEAKVVEDLLYQLRLRYVEKVG